LKRDELTIVVKNEAAIRSGRTPITDETINESRTMAWYSVLLADPCDRV